MSGSRAEDTRDVKLAVGKKLLRTNLRHFLNLHITLHLLLSERLKRPPSYHCTNGEHKVPVTTLQSPAGGGGANQAEICGKDDEICFQESGAKSRAVRGRRRGGAAAPDESGRDLWCVLLCIVFLYFQFVTLGTFCDFGALRNCHSSARY